MEKRATFVVMGFLGLCVVSLVLDSFGAVTDPPPEVRTARNEEPWSPEDLERVPAAPGGAAAVPLAQPGDRRRTARLLDVQVFASPFAVEQIGEPRAPELAEHGIAVAWHETSDRDAIEHAITGKADAALVTVPPSASERSHGLAELLLGDFVVALVVHADNPIRSLQRADVRRVLSGDALDWIELGRHQAPVQIVRPLAERRADRIANLLIPGDSLTDGIELATDAAILARVSRTPDALGIVGSRALGGPDDATRPVAIDGVPPTRASFVSGHYGYGCTLRLVYRSRPGPGVRGLLAYLQSAHGRSTLGARLFPRD